MGVISRTFAAFTYRNYRLWFVGQLASLVGTFMQASVQGYFAYDITRSSQFLGAMGFAAGFPTFLLLLYGGAICDRVSRRKVFLISQLAAMILATILAALTLFGWVQPWHLIVLSIGLGVTSAFEIPARHALIVELVSPTDLPNAIALNATMFQLALVLGPSVGGLLYAPLGPGWCFVLNALSYIAVILIVLALSPEKAVAVSKQQSTWAGIVEGLRAVFVDPLLRTLFVTVSLVTLFGSVHWSLLPAWAVHTLSGDAATNGYLTAARGAGAMTGALLIAYMGRGPWRRRVFLLGLFLMPTMLILLSIIDSTGFALIALAVLGWAFIVTANSSVAMVQDRVDDRVRGRVMSVQSLAVFGMAPLCALWSGVLASFCGVPVIFAISGIVTMLCVFGVLLAGGARHLPQSTLHPTVLSVDSSVKK